MSTEIPVRDIKRSNTEYRMKDLTVQILKDYSADISLTKVVVYCPECCS